MQIAWRYLPFPIACVMNSEYLLNNKTVGDADVTMNKIVRIGLKMKGFYVMLLLWFVFFIRKI